MSSCTCGEPEKWLPISKTNGFYEISSLGNIRHHINHKSLRYHPDKRGYHRTRVSFSGKKITLKNHREVAIAFHDNSSEKRIANHEDGDKDHNCSGNINWTTDSESIQHAYDTGLMEAASGFCAHRYEGPVLATNLSDSSTIVLHGNSEMAANGFDFRLVSAVVNGKRHSHNGYSFTRNL